MSNIIESFNIPDKIIEELSIRHDKYYTLRELHSIFYEKYEEFRIPDIKRNFIDKLKIVFMTIEGEYNNIYRIVKNDKHYLIWSLKSKDELINNFIDNNNNLNQNIDIEIEKELDSFLTVDNVSIIKKMISEQNFSFMFDTNYMDGINHPIHILILNNEIKTIKRLNDLTFIDFTLLNHNGKSCVELAREVNNCELLEFILERIFDAKIMNLMKINDLLKENQKKTYDKITELSNRVTEFSNLNEKLKDLNNLSYVKTIIIIILVCILLLK